MNQVGKIFQWNKVKLALLRKKISILQKIKLIRKRTKDYIDQQEVQKQDKGREEYHSRKEMTPLAQ